MKSNNLLSMAWRNIWRNRRRTLLTLSSIAFGVFLAVMFTAMQDQNWADTIDLAARLGGGHVSIQHPEYLDTPTLTRTVKGVDQLAGRAAETPNVVRAIPRIVGGDLVGVVVYHHGVAGLVDAGGWSHYEVEV